MKPSVAKKLAERIKALEAELASLRDNSKVMELEKKVLVTTTDLESVAQHPLNFCNCRGLRES